MKRKWTFESCSWSLTAAAAALVEVAGRLVPIFEQSSCSFAQRLRSIETTMTTRMTLVDSTRLRTRPFARWPKELRLRLSHSLALSMLCSLRSCTGLMGSRTGKTVAAAAVVGSIEAFVMLMILVLVVVVLVLEVDL